MSLFLGSNEIKSIYVGDRKIERAYVGDKLVYENKPFFEWGDGLEAGKEDWWETLRTFVLSADDASLQSFVGKTKTVVLNTAVLGTTQHLVRCIGANQDGEHTLTFQTEDCLDDSIGFGSSATWLTSDVRSFCKKYFDYFPGKSSIKTVSKGTNTDIGKDSVAYEDETVWIPSIYEMGLSSYGYKPVGAEYTKGQSTPYSYYSADAYRTKTAKSYGGKVTYYTRSLSSMIAGPFGSVCCVSNTGTGNSNDIIITEHIAPAFTIG